MSVKLSVIVKHGYSTLSVLHYKTFVLVQCNSIDDMGQRLSLFMLAIFIYFY
jgi:hypothetical protein